MAMTYPMGRVGQHLQGFNGIGFEWTMKDKESRKGERALNFLSGEFVNLKGLT